MIALSRILVPTNLGAPSKAAVAYGVGRFLARVHPALLPSRPVAAEAA